MGEKSAINESKKLEKNSTDISQYKYTHKAQLPLEQLVRHEIVAFAL